MKSRIPGSVFILPPPTQVTTREAIESILNKLGDILQPISRETPIKISKEEMTKMPAIPSNMIIDLRQTLSECDEFASQRQLRAVFTEQRLHVFQTGLHEGSSVGERVDLTINYLIRKNLTSGENGLVILLQVLRDRRDPADEMNRRLARLADELETAISGEPPIQSDQRIEQKKLHRLNDSW